MNFDDAFERLLGHEGGYVSHGNDPGGETKYGISKRSYPGEDIPGMTTDRAKAIYLRDYWGPAGCDAVPDELKFDLFDMAVNAGVRPAVKALQKAVGEAEDGALGPLTIQAAQSMHPLRALLRFSAARAVAFTYAPAWPAFGKGWIRRLAANMEAA